MDLSPDFICLGLHKCATSWIYNCLYQHPDVHVKHDIDFFALERKWSLGSAWYENTLADKYQKGVLTGDLSTFYFVYEKVPARIHSLYPKVKLFVSLRNPVDRCYAHYIQDLKMGHIPKKITFISALEKNPEYITWGKYKKHIRRFLEYFREEQFAVFIYEDLKSKPLQFIKEIYSFIHAGDFEPSGLNVRINPSRLPKYPWVSQFTKSTAKYLRKSPRGEKIWWTIKKTGFLQHIKSWNTSAKVSSRLEDTNLRRQLSENFKKDKEYVEDLLGRKLTHWT